MVVGFELPDFNGMTTNDATAQLLLNLTVEGVGACDTRRKGPMRIGELIGRPLDELCKIVEKRESELVLRVIFTLCPCPLGETPGRQQKTRQKTVRRAKRKPPRRDRRSPNLRQSVTTESELA
jgi:hypothetical protein